MHTPYQEGRIVRVTKGASIMNTDDIAAAAATALAAARVLVSPPDHVSLTAADAHLRAIQESPIGFQVGRALLGCADDAAEPQAVPHIRVIGRASQ